MITVGEAVDTILAIICIAIVASFWIGERRRKSQERRDQEQKAIGSLTASIQQLVGFLEKTDVAGALEGIRQLQGLSSGLEKMCQALCQSNDTVMKGLEVFQRSIDGSSYSTGNREDDQDLEDENEKRQLERRGIPPEEAEARIREARLYRNLR